MIRYIERLNRKHASGLRRFNDSSADSAFTLIELILVVGIIIVLAGLVLSTVGYARKKGAFARAETEIATMSAAIENYKADNGVYPRETGSTDALDAKLSGDPSSYQAASLYLYKVLSGDSAADRNPTGKSYMVFKPSMLLPPGGIGTVTAIADPFGNSYGYSTANQADPTKGYNPTFDLWTTCTLVNSPPTASDQNRWIKNW